MRSMNQTQQNWLLLTHPLPLSSRSELLFKFQLKRSEDSSLETCLATVALTERSNTM